MKSIETEYKGYKFRSRLEARWAVFFDTCGVRWEYEPEGYDLGDGIYYLPDFLLHDVYLRSAVEYPNRRKDIYVEVKGQMTDKDAEKILKFADRQTRYVDGHTFFNGYKNPILIVNNIPDPENFDGQIYDIWEKNDSDAPFFNFDLIDNDDYAAIPGVDTHGRFTLFGVDYLRYEDYDATENAYRLARQARFEHREKPLISKHRDKKEVYDPF